MKNIFQLQKKSTECGARAGILNTSHGSIKTPFFMPVGTQGAVKTLSTDELKGMGADIYVANAYHLYLRPGTGVVSAAGGLHKFACWDRSILTDSGGYQIYSLADLRKISEEGVNFQSHIDGSRHFFTPESVIDIQTALGSDIMMCFDECTPYPCTRAEAEASMNITLNWAKRCRDRFAASGNPASQLLFGIIQGSTYADLRRQSLERTLEIGFDGYALGGLSVGEPRDAMYEIIRGAAPLLPGNLARYAMGVGTPEDIWNSVESGIDMFDCVLPTRNGRNGQALTFSGKINMKNACHREDFLPIEPGCGCPACARYTRAFINHLFHSGELLALKLLSLHNINFMLKLMSVIRNSVENDSFRSEKKKFLENYAR